MSKFIGQIPLEAHTELHSKVFRICRNKGFYCHRCGFEPSYIGIYEYETIPNNPLHYQLEGWCKYSGKKFLTRDHILPRSKGGRYIPNQDNYQPLCNKCNKEKADNSEGQAILAFLRDKKSQAEKLLKSLKRSA